MRPVEAFEFLKMHDLPLIISFPLLEERQHVITGKGICYVQKVHGSSRVTFGRFSPPRCLHSVRSSGHFYAIFEIDGKSLGCLIENTLADGPLLVGDIPASLSLFMRRYTRVEPSFLAPVMVYLLTADAGTATFRAKDISERGIGLVVDQSVELHDLLICGIRLPIEDEPVILTKASVVSRRDAAPAGKGTHGSRRHGGRTFGLELFPHPDDEKMIRLYIMRREVEIRKKIQDQW